MKVIDTNPDISEYVYTAKCPYCKETIHLYSSIYGDDELFEGDCTHMRSYEWEGEGYAFSFTRSGK